MERFGDNEQEITLMLSRYVGQHRSVRSFFRQWLEGRLAGQANWMMNYINVKLIADVAVAMGRVITVPAKPGSSFGGACTCSSPRRSRAVKRFQAGIWPAGGVREVPAPTEAAAGVWSPCSAPGCAATPTAVGPAAVP
jgi:hypothetical protein